MMKTIEIGTPSLCGKDAHLVIAEFKNLCYPIEIEAQNLCPFAVALMELSGCYLSSVFDAQGCKKGLTVPDYMTFQAFAASVQQIATLNGVAVAMKISIDVPESVAETQDVVGAEKPKTQVKTVTRRTRNAARTTKK